MSYRTVKRLLGETSLERKCRFLFGGGLLVLITGSFYFYAWQNSDLVFEQNKATARLLAGQILLETHWKATEDSPQIRPLVDEMALEIKEELLGDIELGEHDWALFKTDTKADPKFKPSDIRDFDAIRTFRRPDAPLEIVDVDRRRNEYVYHRRVNAGKTCILCHDRRTEADLAEGDTLGVVKIVLPLTRTERALHWNNAILLATGIVTAFLAMVAAYAIVRYVIVKPVLHLKDVSDEIARGNLDLRADIHTGDEFEELSHAFNRMLRHLVTVQDELRAVNADLDGKVDELAEVNLTLFEMNQVKDDFLATMSHELRTPLNSILGFSDVMVELGNLDDRQQQYVGNIQIAGRNLMTLVNDLLDLAKIESGKMDLRPAEFPLADVVDRQMTQISPLAEKKNIELTTELDERVVTIEQDPRKLEQILNNLLSNAVKFTPEGGRVRVRTRLYDANQFELEVEDTGIGIALDDQESIFEKFRQGHSVPGQKDAMTREFGGTGLGLSIVRELAKLLGGDVRLVSEFGKGSTFTVRLPVVLTRDEETRLGDTFGDPADTGLTPSRLRKTWDDESAA